MHNQGENLKIIVVTFNRMHYTMRTMASLMKTVPKAKIIIYDNASTDPMLLTYFKELSSTHDNIKTIFSSTNEGWGTAINKAMEEISCYADDFILLSNDDVEYENDWYDKAIQLYNKYPQIGILGLWKHTSHGIRNDYGDLLVKDEMPAVAWLIKPDIMMQVGAVIEKGPCLTKGGNGEDTNYSQRVQEKGYWVAGSKEDLAIHLTGY